MFLVLCFADLLKTTANTAERLWQTRPITWVTPSTLSCWSSGSHWTGTGKSHPSWATTHGQVSNFTNYHQIKLCRLVILLAWDSEVSCRLVILLDEVSCRLVILLDWDRKVLPHPGKHMGRSVITIKSNCVDWWLTGLGQESLAPSWEMTHGQVSNLLITTKSNCVDWFGLGQRI